MVDPCLPDLHPHLLQQADRFAQAAEIWQITLGPKNGYPERTVSRFFIDALLSALPGAHALHEVPMGGTDRSRQDTHIDAILFTDDLCVIAEFKRIHSQEKMASLAEDANRLRRWAPILPQRFKDGRVRRLVLFLGADCWSTSEAGWWTGGSQTGTRWAMPPGISGLRRQGVQVPIPKQWEYWWLWAWGDVEAEVRPANIP